MREETDLIDAEAQNLVRGVADGVVAETTARRRIAELVVLSRAAAWVAGTRPGLNVQQRVDLATSLNDQLVTRVLDPESSFDLALLAEGSLCGWARNTSMAAWRTDPAVTPRGMSALTTYVDPLPSAGGDTDRPSQDRPTRIYHVAAVLDDVDPEVIRRCASVVDRPDSAASYQESQTEDVPVTLGRLVELDRAADEDAVDRAHAMVGFSRRGVEQALQARALRLALGLPRLCVPHDLATRRGLLEVVQADERIAKRALEQMTQVVVAEPPMLPSPGEARLHEGLLALWDDFSADRLEALIRQPAFAVHLLAVQALNLGPKPSRGVVQRFRRTVSAASPGRQWPRVADGLTAAFLARTTEPVSQFDDTNSVAAKSRIRQEATRVALRWSDALARAIEFPGAPLGASELEVADTLTGWLDDAIGDDLDQRLASRGRRGAARATTRERRSVGGLGRQALSSVRPAKETSARPGGPGLPEAEAASSHAFRCAA